MVKEEKRIRVTLLHPLVRHNLEILFMNEKDYLEWKPYLDKIETWLTNQYIDNVNKGRFIDQ